MDHARIEVDDSWKAHLTNLLDPALADIGQKIEDAAKRIVPVESGELRDTITHSMDNGELTISAGSDTVGYAAAVELGTRYMPAQPYLRPAATSVGSNLR